MKIFEILYKRLTVLLLPTFLRQSEKSEKCVFEWLEDDAVCQLIKSTETIEFADYICQRGELEWTEVVFPSLQSWSIAFGEGRLVAIGGRRVTYSDNGGEIWSDQIELNWSADRIAFGNGRFVVVSTSNYQYGGKRADSGYSTDKGLSWTWIQLFAMADNATWRDIIYDKIHDHFIIYQFRTNVAAYTADGGITWVAATLPTSAFWSGIASDGNGRIVLVSSNKDATAYTDDGGVTWQAGGNLPATDLSISKLAYGEGRFVGVSDIGKNNVCSDDGGETWRLLPIKQNNYITFGNGVFVALKYDRKYASYSLDRCETWEDITITNNKAYWSDIVFAGGRFFAINTDFNSAYLIYPPTATTGKAFAKIVDLKRYYGGVMEEEIMKSILTDTEPELTETEYSLLSEEKVVERVEAVVQSFELDTEPEYLNEPIIDDNTC